MQTIGHNKLCFDLVRKKNSLVAIEKKIQISAKNHTPLPLQVKWLFPYLYFDR